MHRSLIETFSFWMSWIVESFFSIACCTLENSQRTIEEEEQNEKKMYFK